MQRRSNQDERAWTIALNNLRAANRCGCNAHRVYLIYIPNTPGSPVWVNQIASRRTIRQPSGRFSQRSTYSPLESKKAFALGPIP